MRRHTILDWVIPARSAWGSAARAGLVVAVAVSAACSGARNRTAQDTPTDAPEARTVDDATAGDHANERDNRGRGGLRRVGRVGAYDPSARRPGGVGLDPEGDGLSIEETFGPLTLPTPNERRLASGRPGPDYWQQQVDYEIDCTLVPSPEGTRSFATGELTGSVRVTYHNNSPHELTYLWLQLEQNLFRTDSLGTLARTPGSVMAPMTADFEGGYTITRIEAGTEPLTLSVYDTLARVELPEPIGPGEVYEFSYDYSFEMPPHLRRLGAEHVDAGTIFEYAQWFPHVCNYDDVHGWNTLPYLGNGEFYTNFGNYRLSVTAPGDYLVTATGELANQGDVLPAMLRSRLEEALASDEPVTIVGPDEVGAWFEGEAPETRTWVFEAENVRTVAWAASDAFIWDAAGADVTDLDGRSRRVLVQSFYPAEAEGWAPEHEAGGSTRMLKHSIEFYSELLYPYPYPHMTNVNGPEGGMEYPMIIFCGDRNDNDGPFGVTDHEVGHTWFPMIVNTDERRHMWQDEGFNTFINIYSRAAWNETEPSVSWHARQTANMASADRPQPIIAKPDIHWPRWVGGLNYRKTGLGLYLLREEILGPVRFDRAFKGYVHAWAFKHPQPADFFRAMEDGAGVDLAWFWRGWFMSSGHIDQAVTEAVDLGDGRVGVDLVNKGQVVMPVKLEVTYDDGSTEIRRLPVEIWHSADVWRAGWNAGGKVITRVVIDPDDVYPDVDRDNNVWAAPLPEPSEEAEAPEERE